MSDKKDPGYCGLDPLTTGPEDPFWRDGVCQSHDKEYEELKVGNPDQSNWVTQRNLATGILGTMARGVYSIVAGPVYLVVGVLGGAARWAYLSRKKGQQGDQ